MASLPISRFKMIFEKWLSLQVICIIYEIIIIFISPLVGYSSGEIGTIFTNLVYGATPYMFLASIIVQFLLSSVAILLSLVIGSKGVIGILFVLGFLSLIGALGPMIYNIVTMQNPNVNFLLKSSKSARKKYSFTNNDSKQIFKQITDIRGWDMWNFNGDSLQTVQDYYNTKISLDYSFESMTNEVKAILAAAPDLSSREYQNYIIDNKDKYALTYDLIANQKIKFDDVTFAKYQGNNEFEILENDNFGINLLGNFYNQIKDNQGVTMSLSSDDDETLGVNNFDQSKITTSQNKAVFNVIGQWYKKEAIIPKVKDHTVNNSINYSTDMTNIVNKIISDSNSNSEFSRLLKQAFNFSYNSKFHFDNRALDTVHYFATNLLNEIREPLYGFNDSYSDLTSINGTIEKINAKKLNYRLMGYLNIWQQWMVMWTGNKYDSSQLGFLPINNFLGPKAYEVTYKVNNKQAINYFIGVNFLDSVEVINLPALISVYMIFSLGISCLSVWAITRKDFI